QHGDAGGGGRVGRSRDGRGRAVKRSLGALLAIVLVVGGIALYVVSVSPPWFERIRYPLRYSEYVRVHARENDLDPALLAAVIYQESKFRPAATSPSGAIGLMQITPDTAHGRAIRTGGSKFGTSDLLNPA